MEAGPAGEPLAAAQPVPVSALVVVLLGVPVLAVSMTLAWAGTARALLRWLGAAAFMLYDSVLFLLDVAMLGLAAWSVGTVLWPTDVAGLGRRFTGQAPARGVDYRVGRWLTGAAYECQDAGANAREMVWRTFG